MTKEAIQTAIQRKHFRKSLRLPHGEQVRIKDGNHVAIHPDANTLVVFEPKGGFRIIDIALISELQTA